MDNDKRYVWYLAGAAEWSRTLRYFGDGVGTADGYGYGYGDGEGGYSYETEDGDGYGYHVNWYGITSGYDCEY
jgi:hypothetical protein